MDVFYYCDNLKYVSVPEDYEGEDFCGYKIYPPKGADFFFVSL